MKVGAKFQSYEEPLDPANPGDWVLITDTPWLRYWEKEQADGMVLTRTEWKSTQALVEHNKTLLNENAGKRWGDGQVTARVPMNEYFASGYAEANKQRDYKWMNRFLRARPEFKIFPGDM